MNKSVELHNRPDNPMFIATTKPNPAIWPNLTTALLIYTVESHLTVPRPVLRVVDTDDHGFISECIAYPEHTINFLDIVRQELTIDEPQILTCSAMMTADRQQIVLPTGEYSWRRKDNEAWTFSFQENIYLLKDHTPQAQQLTLFFNAGRRYTSSLHKD